MKRIGTILLLILASVCHTISYARENDGHSFKRISIEQGLSNATVNDILIDSEGIVWIATKDGLDSYDGTAVKVFHPSKTEEATVISSKVTHIANGPDSRLYMIVPDNLCVFDKQTESFSIYPCEDIECIDSQENILVGAGNRILVFAHECNQLQPMHTLPEGTIITSLAAAGDNLWIGTREDGVFLSRTGAEPVKILQTGKVADIYTAPEGDIWVSTWTEGLYKICMDADTGAIRHKVFNTSNSGLSSNFVRSCCEDEYGTLFIGTIKGLDMLDRDSARITHSKTIDNSDSGPVDESIWKIRTDRQGNIWIATYYNGVYYFNPGRQSFKRELGEGIIGRMYADSKDNVWIATENGICFYDRGISDFRWYGAKSNGSEQLEHVKALLLDDENGVVWAAADMSGLFRLDIRSGRIKAYYNDPSDITTIPGNRLRDMVPYKQDSIVIATQSGLGIFCTKTGKCRRILSGVKQIKVVTDVSIDSSKRIWITDSSGLYLYDPATGALQHFCTDILPTSYVSGTFIDTCGNVWVYTLDSGFYLYQPRENSFKHFCQENCALASNCIYAIKEVQARNLLILATSSGFSTFNTQNGRVKNYDTACGLPFSSSSENALHVSKDETIFLGSNQGIVSFKAEDLLREPRRFDIVISHFSIDGLSAAPDISKGLTIVSGENAAVRFSATNYIDFDRIQLACQVDGRQYRISADNTISLKNLKSGRHDIRITAVDVPEDICPPLEFIVKVKLQTSTIWNISILLLLTIAAAIFAIYTYLRKKKSAAVKPAERQSALIQKARAVIEANLDDCDFDIAELGKEMGMSRTVLFSRFKTEVKTTPNEFITHIRLEKAAELLGSDNSLSVADIAGITGFRSAGYFSQKFKDAYNVTPLAYRKMKTNV